MARWVTPGGGVDPGESHFEAGVRELEEETGLALTTPGEPVVWENDFDVEWDALTTTLGMRFSIELRQMHSNRLMHNGPMTRALPSYAISDLEHFAAVDCQNMTNDDAVEFGILAVHVIKKWNLNLAVEIILGTDVVFKAKLKSTNADNDPWLTGKSSSSETIERTIALGDASPP